MSYEYIAKIPPGNDLIDLSNIVDDLSNKPDWVLLERTHDSATFRFVSIPERENWKEDLLVKISSSEIYVAFYLNRGKILGENFLLSIVDHMARLGVDIQFEEL